MFAQLGNIQFELITYFNGIKESSSYNFAQHERINQKPLQITEKEVSLGLMP